jgi:hypothetical protein
MKISVCAFLLVWTGLCPFLSAEPPVAQQQPVSIFSLERDGVLPSGANYGGDKTWKVRVDPAQASGKPASLVLELAEGAALSDCTVVVGNGGLFRSKGGTLTGVTMECEPGGTIELEQCTLMQANFFAPNNSVAPRKITLRDCTLRSSQIYAPYLSGVSAKNCRLISCTLGATKTDARADSARFVSCFFSRCHLLQADVLLTTSKSLFEDIVCKEGYPNTLGDYLEKPVIVQLMWAGTAPQPPASAGKVHFEFIPYDKAMQETGAEVDGLSNSEMLQRRTNLISHLKDPQPVESRPMVNSVQSITATPGMSFKSRIATVNALLISQLSSGEEAGQVSKLTLTALPSQFTDSSKLKFNQEVGQDMLKALNEVSKFAQLRHGGLPGGHVIELGFADKYIAKDGPSAAVACALLLETAITGKELDPTFAVTGDMNADGSVQPIGGVAAKVRGATKGGCKIVGIPMKNEKAIPDLLLLEGPMPLVQIGIFSISKFDEALALAEPNRADALARALAELENVRNVLTKLPTAQMLGMLRSPQAEARLQYILQAAPNCLSAKYLLLFAQGRSPRSLSIGGSIEAADSTAMGLIKAIENDVEKNVNTLKGDEVGASIFKLRNLRPKLDPRVWPYVDNVVAYGEVIRGPILNPIRSEARFNDVVKKAVQTAKAAKAAFEKLTGDPQVREELGL